MRLSSISDFSKQPTTQNFGSGPALANTYALSAHFSRDNSCVVLWLGVPTAEIPRPVLSDWVMGQDSECEANEASRVRRIYGTIFRVPVSS